MDDEALTAMLHALPAQGTLARWPRASELNANAGVMPRTFDANPSMHHTSVKINVFRFAEVTRAYQ